MSNEEIPGLGKKIYINDMDDDKFFGHVITSIEGQKYMLAKMLNSGAILEIEKLCQVVKCNILGIALVALSGDKENFDHVSEAFRSTLTDLQGFYEHHLRVLEVNIEKKEKGTH